MSDLVDLLAIAAREAGAVLMKGYRTHPATREKTARDLVTDFDLASEALLRERLAKTGIRVVAEESGGAPAGETLFVDPLDGTTNFSHGHPFFCVSIGYVDLEGLAAGVVFAPALGVEWRAERGVGATRNGEPCRVSTIDAIDHALLATGFSPHIRSEEDFARFIRVKKVAQAMRRCGSAALDLCLVADGTYDGYWEGRLNPWDFAGGACLVEQAGGRVTGLDGERFDPVHGHVCATNGVLHEALLRLILH